MGTDASNKYTMPTTIQLVIVDMITTRDIHKSDPLVIYFFVLRSGLEICPCILSSVYLIIIQFFLNYGYF